MAACFSWTSTKRCTRPGPCGESSGIRSRAKYQARILDAAIRAPSGGNAQSWRFLLVDDHALIARLGPLYRESLAELWQTAYRDRRTAAEADPGSARSVQFFRMVRSAQYLADHFEDVPLFLFAFAPNALSGGSIFPAVWSAMLAAPRTGGGVSHHDRAGRLPGQRDAGGARRPAGQWLGQPLLRFIWLSDRAVGDGVSASRPTKSLSATSGARPSNQKSRCPSGLQMRALVDPTRSRPRFKRRPGRAPFVRRQMAGPAPPPGTS